MLFCVGAGRRLSLALCRRDRLACCYVGETIDLAAGPANLDGVGFVALAQAESQDEFAGRKVAGAAAQHLRLRVAVRREPHDGADTIPVGFCAHELQPNAAIGWVTSLRFIAK